MNETNKNVSVFKQKRLDALNEAVKEYSDYAKNVPDDIFYSFCEWCKINGLNFED